MPKSISLCLSGGGFRATLFHLGVIRALREFNLLKEVRYIFSVSGGSLLAAHLALNWERYASPLEREFRAIAGNLIALVRSDLRGRLVRRWLLLGWLPHYHRDQQLIRAYDRFYRRAVLEKLRATKRPRVYLLATSMISGEVCAFTSEGLLRNCATESQELIPLADVPVSVAVAASSAFPVFFPPVYLDRKILGVTGPEMLVGEVLTDGGVFDNLGVKTAVSMRETNDTTFVVSDASAPFHTETKDRYGLIVGRTKRTSDILMNRVAHLAAEALAISRPDTVIARIDQIVKSAELPKAVGTTLPFPLQAESIQRWVKSVRTDLDFFSDVEIRTTCRHGFEVGAARLYPLCDNRIPVTSVPVNWDPSAEKTIYDDLGDRINSQVSILDRLARGQDAAAVLADAEVQTQNPDDLAEIKRARRRRLRLWNSRDPFCWIGLFGLLTAITAAVAWLLLRAFH